MRNFERLAAAAVLAIGAPAAAFAQSPAPPHQHETPSAAQPPSQAQPQHQGSAAAQPGQQHQGENGADCQCSCCRMMRRMMQEHANHPPSAEGDHSPQQQH